MDEREQAEVLATLAEVPLNGITDEVRESIPSEVMDLVEMIVCALGLQRVLLAADGFAGATDRLREVADRMEVAGDDVIVGPEVTARSLRKVADLVDWFEQEEQAVIEAGLRRILEEGL